MEPTSCSCQPHGAFGGPVSGLIDLGFRALIAISLVATALGVGAPASASAVTLDFSPVLTVSTEVVDVASPYEEDGFVLTATNAPGNVELFRTVGTLRIDFTGSATLYHAGGNGEITLTRTDGGPFHLLSMDIAELPSFHPGGITPLDLDPFDITFTALRKNGATLVETFSAHPFPTIDTFEFHGFTNLVSLTWFQGGGGAPGLSTHQFDKIVLRPIPAAVPQPMSLLLVTAGLATTAIIATSRRLLQHTMSGSSGEMRKSSYGSNRRVAELEPFDTGPLGFGLIVREHPECLRRYEIGTEAMPRWPPGQQ
jgi:hypothetical protein